MPERDVEWELRANDRSRPAVRSATEGMEDLGDEVRQTTRKMDELGDQTGQLARKLIEARAASLALARSFDQTGDVGILKQFQKAEREAAKLGRVMKTLKFDAPDVKQSGGLLGKLVKFGKEAGLIAGNASVETFGQAFGALPAPLKTGIVAGLVGAAAIAAPIMAGAIEGAVVASIGLGGIAGGLILGAQDPRVGAAYELLGTRIMDKLKAATLPFTAQLLSAAPKLSDGFDRELPGLTRTFAILSTAVGPLLDDLIAAGHELLPSIERAAATAVPIIISLGKQLQPLAGDVGDLIDAFSAAGPGAAAALGLIIYQLRGMISLLAFGAQASAPFLNAFGKIVELGGFIPQTGDNVTDLSDTLIKGGAGAATSASQFASLANSMGNTANQAQALNDAFSRMFSEQMNLDQANLAVKQGLLNVKESLKENGKTLDDTTQKGLNNIGVIQQQIANYEQQRQAAIAAGNGTVEATEQANAAYSSQVAALRAVLIQMGLTAAQVDRLIGAYAAIPRDITTNVTTVYRTKGTPPGYSDELTGHSRTGSSDYSGLSGWAPANFAAATRGAFAAMAGGTSGAPTLPAMEVHTENVFTVLLDGQPFQAIAVRTARAAEKRAAWRTKVGPRG